MFFCTPQRNIYGGVQKNLSSVSNACVRYSQECTINMLLGQVHSRYPGGMGQDITKSITETAERNRGEKDLVESIYRMYSIHQGIDTAGIIDRLGLRNIYSK